MKQNLTAFFRATAGTEEIGCPSPLPSGSHVFTDGARRLRRFTIRLAGASEDSQPGEGSHVEAA